jgi:hypothetical protein
MNLRARPGEILDFDVMEATSPRPGYELWRPNREKAQSKTMKAIVAFVLLVSAGLLFVITIGGWDRLEGTGVGIMSLFWAGLYVLFAFLVARWNRGILPVASALAIILAIFAAVSAPTWFARSKEGLTPPPLPDDLIGLLVILVVPVQLLLIAVAMVGFNQNWHVEEERPTGGVPLHGEDDEYGKNEDGEPGSDEYEETTSAHHEEYDEATSTQHEEPTSTDYEEPAPEDEEAPPQDDGTGWHEDDETPPRGERA